MGTPSNDDTTAAHCQQCGVEFGRDMSTAAPADQADRSTSRDRRSTCDALRMVLGRVPGYERGEIARRARLPGVQ